MNDLNNTNVHWEWKAFKDLTLQELYSIIQVRERVFVVEQELSYVDCDNYDQKAWHLSGYQNGKLVAYLRAFPPEVKFMEASFGKVLVAAEARRIGLGKKLTATGLQKMKETFGETPVRISAQSYLENFYASFGFKTVSEEYLEENLPHLQMLLRF